MKEEKDANKNTGTDAGQKINTSAFMRQIAVAGINEDMPVAVNADNQADELIPEPEVKSKEPVKKKKQGATIDYESVFLIRNELQSRQGLYIGKENYEVLQTLVRSIRFERISVSGLVDNIIRHHIELYEEDINRIFEENIRRPINKNK